MEGGRGVDGRGSGRAGGGGRGDDNGDGCICVEGVSGGDNEV